MNKHERGCTRGRVVASTLGLVLYVLENLLQVRRICWRANVVLHEQVHEARDDANHVEAKVFSVREKTFVCRVVSKLSDRIPQGPLVGRKAKALDAFVQVFSMASEMIDEALESSSQEHASRPRGRTGNGLSLFERFTNVFGHVLSRLNTAVNGPNRLLVDREDDALAVRASENARSFERVGQNQVGGRDFQVVVEDGFVDKATDIDRRFFIKNDGQHVEKANNATVRATQ